MKRFIAFALCSWLVAECGEALGQSPLLINYQAVARDAASGAELSNQSIFLVVKILQGGASGSIVYQEEHSAIQTDAFGLFDLQIGNGAAISGSMAGIAWEGGPYWLAIEIDAGSGLQNAGTMQLVSVPYALHAKTASDVDDADADPGNERITDFTFDELSNELSITEAGSTLSQDLSSLKDDADADPLNELISSLSFDSNSSVLSLTEGTTTWQQNLSALINDADADSTNESLTSFSLQGQNLVIEESDTWSVNLGQLFSDNDSTNELITDLELNGSVLTITEGSQTENIDLATLVEDTVWIAPPNSDLVYTTVGDVGIGTTAPQARLDVRNTTDDAATLLKVQGSTAEPIVNVHAANVGIGTSSASSTFQVNGSVGYGVQILSNMLGTVNYTVTDADHIIVCIVSPLGLNSFNIEMPDAATCEGRVITVRKTGTGPFSSQVMLDFGSSQLDFLQTSFEMDANQRETARFLSLGSAGWTKLFED